MYVQAGRCCFSYLPLKELGHCSNCGSADGTSDGSAVPETSLHLDSVDLSQSNGEISAATFS